MSEIKKPLPKKPGKPEEVKVVMRAAPPLKRAVPKPDAEIPAKPGLHEPAAPPAAAAKPGPVVKAAPPLKPPAKSAPTGTTVPPAKPAAAPGPSPKPAPAVPKPSAAYRADRVLRGSPSAGGETAPQARRLRAALLAAFPGLLFVGTLLAGAGYVLMLQALVRRWPAQLGSIQPAAFRWELPELLVWAFIGSGVLFLTGVPWLRVAGLNGLIVLLGLYFLQGLSIAAFLFRRFQLPRFLATLSVILLVFQPFFTLLVGGLGLFDVWFAFRRLSLPRPPRQT